MRTAIGATMQDMNFYQRWLVVDVATAAELNQWDGVHQVCDPHRAGTFMRIGKTRYRWEFRLLPGETAADFNTMTTLRPLIRPWVEGVAAENLELVRVAEYTFRAQVADRWRRDNIFLLGDAAHLTPPFIGQGLCAGIRDAIEPELEARRRGQRMAAGERAQQLRAGAQTPRPLHDPLRARDGHGHDGGRRGRQSAQASGGPATASDPRAEGEDRRQHDARVAQQRAGNEITRTTAIGGPVVPESCSARRQASRRGRRRQVRRDHVGSAQPIRSRTR